MATQKIISLFEDVRTGIAGITAKDKKQADKDAVWFYEKYKTNFPKKTDTEIEKEAKILIDRFLYIDPLVIKELKSKHLKDISNPKFDKNGKKISIPPLEALIGKNLKSKLEKHFKQIEKPLEIEENASKKISRDLLEGLIDLKLLPTWSVKKNLSTWSKNDISAVINLYHKKYHDLSIEKDDDFAAYKRLEAAYQRIAKYPVADREPEFFKSIVGQFVHWEEEPDKFFLHLNKDLKRILKKYKTQEDEQNSKQIIKKYSIEDVNSLFVDKLFERPDSDLDNKLSKIENYLNEIRNTESIPKQEKRLFDILIEIVTDANIDAKTEKEISDLCKKRLMDEGITAENFRAIKSRLMKMLSRNKGAVGMLHFEKAISDELNELYNIINSLDLSEQNYITTENEINLKAYRFSDDEMKKMLWLKELFESDGYTVGLFPEVYYSDYDDIKPHIDKQLDEAHDNPRDDNPRRKLIDYNVEIWKIISEKIIKILDDETTNYSIIDKVEIELKLRSVIVTQEKEFDKNKTETREQNLRGLLKTHITADALGKYIFSNTEKDCENGCGKITEEGYIVLYKDRIEDLGKVYSIIVGATIEETTAAIRFNVLMHELGHWFTHWAIDNNGNNWKCGYNNKPDDEHTHEALAQLINYWCVEKDEELKKYLLWFEMSPPPESEYQLYKHLTKKSQFEILEKVKDLRVHCSWSGEMGYLYLASDYTNLLDFLAYKIYEVAGAREGNDITKIKQVDIMVLSKLVFLTLEYEDKFRNSGMTDCVLFISTKYDLIYGKMESYTSINNWETEKIKLPEYSLGLDVLGQTIFTKKN